MTRIALLSALPQEYDALRKLTGPWHLTTRVPFQRYVCSSFDKEVTLVETGMGKQKVQDALKWTFRTIAPDLILSAGFAGSLCQSIGVGDVFLGEYFVDRQSLSGLARSVRFHLEPSEKLARFCRDNLIRSAQIVTADRPESKSLLSQCFGEAPSLMDMESYFAAQFALESRIPFFCFRAVSDGLQHEIDFDLDEIIDSRGRVRMLKVLSSTLREPPLVKSYFASWRRSGVAAQRLGEVLAAFLSLPISDLQELALKSHFWKKEWEPIKWRGVGKI